jgi:HEAT repeat protein
MSSEIMERIEAMNQLRDNFTFLPDKKQALDDFHRLTKDEESFVRWRAAKSLGAVFPHVPDKKQAWDDFHRLTKDKDSYVRWSAAESLGAAFPHVPDKKQALDDLIRLTKDKNSDVRGIAAGSLVAAFPHVPDKKQAWDDLIRLTKDEVWGVRERAAGSLGVVFPHVPDKKQAWDDLIRFTKDKDSDMRWMIAAGSLGAAFPHVPDKKQAWDDLHRLTMDQFSNVRASANHSLGRACIFKATEAESEEDFRKELEIALTFFEQSSVEATYFNPARFCRLFYRSFYMITFMQTAEGEVQEYLAEAKRVSAGSESKEKLLEAVENLARALSEAQKVREKGLGSMKCDLNTYRRYCEHAAELVQKTKEKAPGATKMLERGFPIIDKRIKELLEGIEAKAEKFCVESRQTPFEGISRSVYGYTKGLGDVGYTLEVEARLNKAGLLLQNICTILPEESMNVICSQLSDIAEADLYDKARIIESALYPLQVQISNLKDKLAERDRWIEYLRDVVLKRLDIINYSVFKLKLRSGEIIPTLRGIQTELNRLKTIQTDLKNFGLSLMDLGNVQHQDLHSLNEEITRLAGEIETKVIPQLPETSDAQRVIEELQDLKQSKGEAWFNRAAALSSIISLILAIL